MNDCFFKFPSTPHLAALPGVEIRDDKIFTEKERLEFLTNEIVIEEKVDGANLGFSFDPHGNIRIQNRGAYLELPRLGQWKKIDEWLERSIDELFECLSDEYILFGEWCYAQHSIFYDCLPDWFLAFDIFDLKAGRFLATHNRDIMFAKMSVFKVPEIARGHFNFSEIQDFISRSKLTNGSAEGIYLRVDRENWLESRAKLIRPAFVQAIDEHWSHSIIKRNIVN